MQDALSADIRLLGGLLGQVIRRLDGEAAYNLEEDVRAAAKGLRASPSLDEARRLRDRLDGLSVPALRGLTRAFTVYFDLVNLAEQQARVRAIRDRTRRSHPAPVAETPLASLTELRDRGVTAAQVGEHLAGASLDLVFTAHPSEARRRTMLEKVWRVTAHLDRLERENLLPAERDGVLAGIAAEIEALWLTDLVRATRPTVLDEVRQGLDVVEGALFDVVPRLYRRVEEALIRAFPGESVPVPAFLRFGSWIGGDRDGHPDVTHAVTAEAVRLQQDEVLRYYLTRVDELGGRLSLGATLAPPGADFLAWLDGARQRLPELASYADREPYRLACRAVAARLQRTRAHARTVSLVWGEAAAVTPPGVYLGAAGLLEDLARLESALRGTRAAASAEQVRDLARVVEVFGLHLLTLDVRQHSGRHAGAVAEILARAGVCADYRGLTPDARFAVLAAELPGARPLIPAHLPYSPETTEVVQTFRTLATLLERQSPDCLRRYIISMATEPAHVLEVLLLAREAGLFDPAPGGVSRLDIVPLFETLDALRGARAILGALYELPLYREQLRRRGGVQEVMIGYSDSNKESGFLQSVWALYEAQKSLAEQARAAGVTVVFFHGRGGAIGRGGGPANRVILAQPPGTVEGRIRITEQGEVIADRYGHHAIAERHLDQVVSAVLLSSFPHEDACPDPAWEGVLERLAGAARRHYRALVEDPEFLTYFRQATPIDEISSLKIGSRPARRGPAAGIEDLRAIPWVFSWMQSRHTLPGWYGLGSAIDELIRTDPAALGVLKAMGERWPFWATALDNAQMILAKADLTIARLYADLVDDQALAGRIYERLAAEYRLTVELVCRVTGQSAVLERMPVLQRSIAQRNPYVDPLSFIQLVLLRRLRRGDGSDPGEEDELRTAVLESINGVAAGLKNTG